MSQANAPSSCGSSFDRTVLITGIGPVCALGTGVESLWTGLVEGRSGLGPITVFDPAGFRSRLGGQIADLSARACVPKHYRKAVKVMARDTQIAVVAAHAAVEDAGLVTLQAGEDASHTYAGERIGCQIGAGLIAAETAELSMAAATAVDQQGRFSDRLWGTVSESGGQGGMENLAPLWMLKYLPNMLACHLTILHGTQGPSNTITCGEAAGLLSIGESLRVIQRGAADVCFSGGAESKLNLMGMIRLDLAGLLAPTESGTMAGDEIASDGAAVYIKPFDRAGQGTLLAEGGGVLILEEAELARARGVRAYAMVEGFGAAQSEPPYGPMDLGEKNARSPDALVQVSAEPERPQEPDLPQNQGLADAIKAALADANLKAEDIDAIVPTGSGLARADLAEAGALRAVFGKRLARIPLVLTRPALGECMAGNGGLQTAVGALCLHHQKLPARPNAGEPIEGLDACCAPAREAVLSHVLVCTSGLGGQNGALILGRA